MKNTKFCSDCFQKVEVSKMIEHQIRCLADSTDSKLKTVAHESDEIRTLDEEGRSKTCYEQILFLKQN